MKSGHQIAQLNAALTACNGDLDAIPDHTLTAIGTTRADAEAFVEWLTSFVVGLQTPIGSAEDIDTFLAELDRLNRERDSLRGGRP